MLFSHTNKIKNFFKILIKRRLLFLSLLISGVFLAVTPVSAGGTALALGLVSKLIAVVVNVLGKLIMWAIDTFMWLVQYNGFLEADVVRNGWVVVRDVGNMFFVVFFIVMAFSTIWGFSKYEYKKMLSKMLIMAVLMNFSKGIAGVLIDFFQVIMLTFVSAFREAGPVNFTQGLGITKLLSINPNANNVSNTSALGAYVLALVMALIAAIVVVQLLIILVVRMIALWILVVISPMAYVLDAFPDTQKYASMWWNNFFKYVLIGPVLAFFLWLSLSVMSTDIYKGINAGVIAKPSSKGQKQVGINIGISEAGTYQQMIGFVVSIAMLMFAINFAKSSGVAGGGFGASMVAKMRTKNPVAQAVARYKQERAVAKAEKPTWGARMGDKAAGFIGTGIGLVKGGIGAGFRFGKEGGRRLGRGLIKGVGGKKVRQALEKDGREVSIGEWASKRLAGTLAKGTKYEEMAQEKGMGAVWQEWTSDKFKLAQEGRDIKQGFSDMDSKHKADFLQKKQKEFFQYKGDITKAQKNLVEAKTPGERAKAEEDLRNANKKFDNFARGEEARFGEGIVDKEYGYYTEDNRKIYDDYKNLKEKYQNNTMDDAEQDKYIKLLEVVDEDTGLIKQADTKGYKTKEFSISAPERILNEAVAGFQSYGGWDMRQKNIIEDQEVNKAAQLFDKQKLNISDLQRILTSSNVRQTERLAAALQLAVKKGFSSPNQVATAKNLMRGNQTMKDRFEAEMDKGQAHLNYNFKDAKDNERFQKNYDAGSIRLSDLSSDAWSNDAFLNNLKSVMPSTGAFIGAATDASKKSKTYKDNVSTGLNAILAKEGAIKYKDDGVTVDTLNAAASALAQITGEVHKIFRNKEGKLDQGAVEEFLKNAGNDVWKKIKYKHKDIANSDDYAIISEAIAKTANVGNISNLFRSYETEQARGLTKVLEDTLAKIEKKGDKATPAEVQLKNNIIKKIQDMLKNNWISGLIENQSRTYKTDAEIDKEQKKKQKERKEGAQSQSPGSNEDKEKAERKKAFDDLFK